jgi:hypothetical protein
VRSNGVVDDSREGGGRGRGLQFPPGHTHPFTEDEADEMECLESRPCGPMGSNGVVDDIREGRGRGFTISPWTHTHPFTEEEADEMVCLESRPFGVKWCCGDIREVLGGGGYNFLLDTHSLLQRRRQM